MRWTTHATLIASTVSSSIAMPSNTEAPHAANVATYDFTGQTHHEVSDAISTLRGGTTTIHMVSGADIRSDDSLSEPFYWFIGGHNRIDGSFDCMMAPVFLPNDTMVSSIFMFAEDQTSSDIWLTLYRKNRLTALDDAVALATVSTTGASADMQVHGASVDVPIDNDAYTYYLAGCGSMDHRLFAAWVVTSNPPIDVEVLPPTPADPKSMGTPNPFTRSTSISYWLAAPAGVVIEIFDASGRRVRSFGERRGVAGMNRVLWDGLDDGGRVASPGVYFVRIDGSVSVGSKLIRLP